MNRIQAFINRYQTTGWAISLLVGGFLVQLLILLVFAIVGQKELFGVVMEKLILPANFAALAKQPWSIITWPFFEVNFINNGQAIPDAFGILFTGIALWFFGRVHQQLVGDQRTYRLLLLAIPIIGLATVTYSSIVGFYYPEKASTEQVSPFSQVPTEGEEAAEPSNDPIQNLPKGEVPAEGENAEKGGIQLVIKKLLLVSGGMALIMVLILSCITLVPDYPLQLFFIGQVKIVWIGIIFLLISIAINSFFTPMAFAEAFGALLGFLHIVLLKRGTDVTEAVWNYYKPSDTPKPRMKVKRSKPSKPSAGGRPKRSSGRKEKQAKGSDISQEIIDKILDKISETGYESLSREEKELLFRASTEKGDENNG